MITAPKDSCIPLMIHYSAFPLFFAGTLCDPLFYITFSSTSLGGTDNVFLRKLPGMQFKYCGLVDIIMRSGWGVLSYKKLNCLSAFWNYVECGVKVTSIICSLTGFLWYSCIQKLILTSVLSREAGWIKVTLDPSGLSICDINFTNSHDIKILSYTFQRSFIKCLFLPT